jgi:hypothetical protein
MAICDEGGQGLPSSPPPRRRRNRLAGALAAGAGLLAVAVTAVVLAGRAQLVSSPMATAGTTRATPWVPRPAFLGRPAPHPSTSVSAQGPKADAEAKAIGGWVNKAGVPFGAISDAMTNLGKALDNGDPATVRRACIQLGNTGEKFAKTLPTPNEEMTAASQTAVSEIAAATSACLADPPDFDGLTNHATEANKQLATVAKIASGG